MQRFRASRRAPHGQIFKKCLFEYKITCNIEICKKKSHSEKNIVYKKVFLFFVASWARCVRLAG